MKLSLAVLLSAALAAPVFAQNKNADKTAPAHAPQEIATKLDELRKHAQELIDKASGNKAAAQDEPAKAQLRGVVGEIETWTHEGVQALKIKAPKPAKAQPAAKTDYKTHAQPPLADAGEEGASWKLEHAAAQCRADEAGLVADLLRLHDGGADAAAMKGKQDQLDKVVKRRKDAESRMPQAAAKAKERAAKAPPKK